MREKETGAEAGHRVVLSPRHWDFSVELEAQASESEETILEAYETYGRTFYQR